MNLKKVELKKRHSGKDRNLRKEIRKVVAKDWE